MTKKIEKKFFIPGAEKFKVIFDRRCSIPVGGKLTLSSSFGSPIVFTSTVTNWVDKSTVLSGETLTVSYEFVETEDGVDTNRETWGFAFLTTAVGAIYEHCSAYIDIDAEAPSQSLAVIETIESKQTNNKDESESVAVNLQDIYVEESPDIGHDNEMLSIRPPSRREPRISDTSRLEDLSSQKLEVEVAEGLKPYVGSLVVPHASEIEVAIERLHLGDAQDWKENIEVTISYIEDGKKLTT
jgi:hypothetical protein